MHDEQSSSRAASPPGGGVRRWWPLPAAVASGVLVLAFPLVALALPLAYLTLLAVTAMKESRRAGADRTNDMETTRS